MAGRRARRARPPAPRSQHVLRSGGLAAELVASANLPRDEVVVELGAGTGRLTAELARVSTRVIAVELDSPLAARLRGRWAHVEVVEGDAAELELPNEPFGVVANLPFHRTTELLHHLLDDPLTPLRRADLIVEWAVAHKHAFPWPSSVNGVLWGARYEASVTRRLSRQRSLRHRRWTPACSSSGGDLHRWFSRRSPRSTTASWRAAFDMGSARSSLAASSSGSVRSRRPGASSTPISGRRSSAGARGRCSRQGGGRRGR